jgi:hypothetical protein
MQVPNINIICEYIIYHTFKLNFIGKIMIYQKENYNFLKKNQWKFKIWNLFIMILSIYKSCDWILHEMVIEIVFNNEI